MEGKNMYNNINNQNNINEFSDLIKYYLEGNSLRKTGNKFFMHKNKVTKILKNNNIIIRNKSESQKGRIFSKEHIINLSNAHKGDIPWNKGKKGLNSAWNKGSGNKKFLCAICGKEVEDKPYRRKLFCSKECRDRAIGNLAGGWQGGLSYKKYPSDWTNLLKESIRQRDNYICKLCGKKQNKSRYSVHHIDYNKKNCDPSNLITLCRSCHSKTNYNRKEWEKLFSNLVLNNLGI